MLNREEIVTLLVEARLSLTAYIATITRSYHLAEDVYQDVCVKVIGREDSFESTERLLAWAHTTARNRAIDLLRARDGKLAGINEELLEALSAAWPGSQSTEVKRTREVLELCLEKLTSNNREILGLRYFEGRSGAEVAERLGRKLETVYRALARIHKTLEECIRLRLIAMEGEP